MVYVCENCGVLFSRASKQDQCPGCGKNQIRSANAEERREYASRLTELIRDRCADGLRFPNLVETEIFVPNSFGFMLPVTALQFDSDMTVEILVEYGESAADRSVLLANVWARQRNGTRVDFLISFGLPVIPEEPVRGKMNRVFSALNGNTAFTEKLRDYIAEQLECLDS